MACSISEAISVSASSCALERRSSRSLRAEKYAVLTATAHSPTIRTATAPAEGLTTFWAPSN